MSLILPSKSSISAVQLSTQSPQFRYSTPLMVFVSARWMWPQMTPWASWLRAIAASVSSYSVTYFTADLALNFRYAASDQ
jgi:hypothetical protein